MAISTDSLVRIANAGGSLVVPTSISTDSLVRIANAVRAKGVGHLTIEGPTKTTDSMIRISNAAPGMVTFDVTA